MVANGSVLTTTTFEEVHYPSSWTWLGFHTAPSDVPFEETIYSEFRHKLAQIIGESFGAEALIQAAVKDKDWGVQRDAAEVLGEIGDIRARARILVRIERLAAGNPGDAKPVGEGVSEM
jgi:hypothetical protein